MLFRSYVRRATSIVQQAMLLRGGQTRHGFSRAITQVAALSGAAQTAKLLQLGPALAPAEVRLLDPAAFRLRSATQRRKALAITVQPRVSRDSRLAAAMHRAEAGAFALSNEDVVEVMRRELRLRGRPIRLSSLTFKTATDVLQAMQAVEAIRSLRVQDMTATKLPTKLVTDFYTADDYLIELRA